MGRESVEGRRRRGWGEVGKGGWELDEAASEGGGKGEREARFYFYFFKYFFFNF